MWYWDRRQNDFSLCTTSLNFHLFLARLSAVLCFRKTQEGCGGLRRENPGAFPKAGPIFQQPFSLPENAQTLARIAFGAAGKSLNHFRKRRHLPENFSSKELQTATAFSSFLIVGGGGVFRLMGLIAIECSEWMQARASALQLPACFQDEAYLRKHVLG